MVAYALRKVERVGFVVGPPSDPGGTLLPAPNDTLVHCLDLDYGSLCVRIWSKTVKALHSRIDLDEPTRDSAAGVSREEQAEAGLAAFFAIAREWGLGNEEARILLGNPSRSRFYELRRGTPGAIRSVSEDTLDRLAYLTGIYAALNILYSADSQTEWLRNDSRVPAEAMYRPWGLGSPLAYMLTGKLKALADVYDYLNSERGGV